VLNENFSSQVVVLDLTAFDLKEDEERVKIHYFHGRTFYSVDQLRKNHRETFLMVILLN